MQEQRPLVGRQKSETLPPGGSGVRGRGLFWYGTRALVPAFQALSAADEDALGLAATVPECLNAIGGVCCHRQQPLAFPQCLDPPGRDLKIWHPGPVKLVSSDGASISLHPAAYQFEMPPPAEDEDEDEGDANWLMISGAVCAADGRRWAFLDPCLTTSEARSLSAWLRRVACGNAAEEPRSIAFTEPNLAFGASDQSAGRVRLQVRFSHEALPPLGTARPQGLAGRHVRPLPRYRPGGSRPGSRHLGS